MKEVSKTKLAAIIILIVIVAAGALYAMTMVSKSINETVLTTKDEEIINEILNVDNMEKIDITNIEENEIVKSLYKGTNSDGNISGYAIFSKVDGYGGPISIYTVTDKEGKEILSMRVGANSETENLGAKITNETFYKQFENIAVPVKLAGQEDLSMVDDTGLVMADGEYSSETDFVNGFKNVVKINVAAGKIVSANWEAYDEIGNSKKELSKNGEYIMTEDGPRWDEQAEAMEKLLIEIQEPSKIELNDEGKTDAVSSVSISVNDFTRLAQKCINSSKGIKENTNSTSVDESTINGVSGATVSSKAVVKAVNSSVEFVRNNFVK